MLSLLKYVIHKKRLSHYPKTMEPKEPKIRRGNKKRLRRFSLGFDSVRVSSISKTVNLGSLHKKKHFNISPSDQGFP